jgi:hypothetical protein
MITPKSADGYEVKLGTNLYLFTGNEIKRFRVCKSDLADPSLISSICFFKKSNLISKEANYAFERFSDTIKKLFGDK